MRTEKNKSNASHDTHRELPWWCLIGPQTRTRASWRHEMRYYSLYSFSSLLFSIVGVLGLFGIIKCWTYESCLLIAIGISSFQSDVIYLGIDTHWRTLDTLLSCFFVSYYVICDTLLLMGFSDSSSVSIRIDPRWRHLLAWAIILLNLSSFSMSQKAVTFREREFYHTLWHFGLSLGIITLKL